MSTAPLSDRSPDSGLTPASGPTAAPPPVRPRPRLRSDRGPASGPTAARLWSNRGPPLVLCKDSHSAPAEVTLQPVDHLRTKGVHTSFESDQRRRLDTGHSVDICGHAGLPYVPASTCRSHAKGLQTGPGAGGGPGHQGHTAAVPVPLRAHFPRHFNPASSLSPRPPGFLSNTNHTAALLHSQTLLSPSHAVPSSSCSVCNVFVGVKGHKVTEPRSTALCVQQDQTRPDQTRPEPHTRPDQSLTQDQTRPEPHTEPDQTRASHKTRPEPHTRPDQSLTQNQTRPEPHTGPDQTRSPECGSLVHILGALSVGHSYTYLEP
ncbi:hypothetical protein WMY93_028317 [Mugilogobius chulae]|uniref:Uncharacterized protein n=1 Tax=Mugilogobius chulae TaxID=88201 RepID=A0AAW0MN27_9GOBI